MFSHFRPCDATRENSFFQMLSYVRANVRTTSEKKQKENSHEGITWSEMGKQNIQAKEFYYRSKRQLSYLPMVAICLLLTLKDKI